MIASLEEEKRKGISLVDNQEGHPKLTSIRQQNQNMRRFNRGFEGQFICRNCGNHMQRSHGAYEIYFCPECTCIRRM